MIHFKDNKNKSALSTRWAQMSKQEQIIEKKKMEIQAKLEAQKQAAALAAQAKLANPTTKEETGSPNIFSNDGSFMSQYKALIDKQNREKEEKEAKDKQECEENRIQNESKQKAVAVRQEAHDSNEGFSQEREQERGSRDRHRRWNDRGRNRTNSPTTPVIEDRKKIPDTTNIPSLMQITVRPPDEDSNPPGAHHQWNSHDGASSNDDYDYERQQDESYDGQEPNSGPVSSDPRSLMGPGPMVPGPMGQGLMGPGPMGHGMGPGPMGPGPMPPGPMGPGPMGPGPMGFGPMGPGLMGPGPMGPGTMGPGPMGPGPMGPGPMGPGPMGSGPIGPGTMIPGPMGPGPMPPGPNMAPNSGPNNMGPGPLMGPGTNMPPVPPYMGGPPNFPMPPNFMGPNGPGGPIPPPNMCGPDARGPGPNGPMPPFFPPFPNAPMPGPPNSMNQSMGPNSSNFGPRPPFGPGGPNFGPNGPPMCPPMPFMPQGQMPPGQMPPSSLPSNTNSETKPLDNIPPPEPMKLQNIPPPMPMPLTHIPKPKDMEPGNIPAPPNSQVLSADCPPPLQRAAAEVAANGDHWENVLKAIHSQDQNLWFLHNPNSNEYKIYRSLVAKIRSEACFDKKPDVKPEDKYEPEFSLEDDDSNDHRGIKEESKDSFGMQEAYFNQFHNNMVKREAAGSQSDDDGDGRRERRKRRKSRWGDDPPVDVKPPGLVAPLPPAVPGAQLSKIDEEGLKLTTINRNNHALMQYAMTNYGTTNLSAEDWKKCEDNFKLNLLYQDMLKKRQEVERLAQAGRHKYEYDSDEDTAEGTWEHKLRAKEMNATEKWATELTKQAAGKHHIGDFLPPEELKKFMEKYSAFKSGKEPDLSDYKEYKLKEDNVGFKMLQKLGWNEGQGLGAEGTGIVEPINKANQPVANLGLGASTSDVVSADDDEFDAYRKRMMLAYRFRPNPLNNPRRPYY